MPIWLAVALATLRTAAIGGPVRALTTGALASTAVSSISGDEGGAFSFLPGFQGGRPTRRRRRRRALTASDRADIGFIAATLGQPAGKAFALVIASRIAG